MKENSLLVSDETNLFAQPNPGTAHAWRIRAPGRQTPGRDSYPPWSILPVQKFLDFSMAGSTRECQQALRDSYEIGDCENRAAHSHNRHHELSLDFGRNQYVF